MRTSCRPPHLSSSLFWHMKPITAKHPVMRVITTALWLSVSSPKSSLVGGRMERWSPWSSKLAAEGKAESRSRARTWREGAQAADPRWAVSGGASGLGGRACTKALPLPEVSGDCAVPHSQFSPKYVKILIHQ